jgi:3-dehydroquinate synthetase
MAEEARRAVRRGWLEPRARLRLVGLLARFGLPTGWPAGIGPAAVRRLLAQDKKRRGRTIRLPRPVRVGRIIVKEEACKDIL